MVIPLIPWSVVVSHHRRFDPFIRSSLIGFAFRSEWRSCQPGSFEKGLCARIREIANWRRLERFALPWIVVSRIPILNGFPGAHAPGARWSENLPEPVLLNGTMMQNADALDSIVANLK